MTAPRHSAMFEATLNRHGYPFHYSVLSKAQELFLADRTAWGVVASEFSVAVRERATRIDFVLGRTTGRFVAERFTDLLLAECKRANPKMSNWLFARAPFTRTDETSRGPVFEVLQEFQDRVEATHVRGQGRPYHVALEVKGDEKGDSRGSSNRPIEEAATQVMSGLAGMAELLHSRPYLLGANQPTRLLPVIFTTAKLWTTTADLGSADLERGAMTLGDDQLEQTKWLWYQYHVTPNLTHALPRMGHGKSNTDVDARTRLGEVLEREYSRAIAVVSPDAIEDFLSLPLPYSHP